MTHHLGGELSTRDVAELAGVDQRLLTVRVSEGRGEWRACFPSQPVRLGSGRPRRWHSIDAVILRMLIDTEDLGPGEWRAELAARMRFTPHSVFVVRVSDSVTITYRPDWSLLDKANTVSGQTAAATV